jgi:hypothetical protein
MIAHAEPTRRRGPSRGIMAATLRLGFINLKLLFGRHWWLFLFALLLWFGWLVLRVLMGWNDTPWHENAVQNLALAPPLLLLAVNLGMNAFAFEIDERTIEGVFTVSGSRYRPWLVRIGTVFACLLASDLLLAALTWVFLVDFPFVGVSLNALVPILLYFSLTLMFSLLFKGAIPAGLAVTPLLLFNVVLNNAPAIRHTRFQVFFNYLDRPSEIDAALWRIMAIQNRLGLLLIIGLILFYTVRLTDKRERLLQ